MRRLTAMLLALLALCTACARTPADPWLQSAAFDAHETAQQLYERALLEDTLVVYTESSRIYSVKQSFEAQYPGLTVDVHHIRGRDLIRMLEKNAETQNYHCDVSVCSDGDGYIANSLVPSGILHKYVPWDMEQHIRPEHNGATLEFIVELVQLLYNDEVYAESPVSNWWELTEERWRGKVLVPNPEVSTSTFLFLASILQNDDVMLEAYRERYGRDPDLPDGVGCGAYYIECLTANDIVLTSSGTEVSEQVGAAGQTDPPVGLTVSSKVRNRELTWRLGVAMNMRPFAGAYSANSVMIAHGSPNVNSAKLFVRWLLGESDGQGEGYVPYLQDCVWSVRTDVSSEAGVDYEALTTLHADKRVVFERRDEIMAQWRLLMEDKRA